MHTIPYTDEESYMQKWTRRFLLGCSSISSSGDHFLLGANKGLNLWLAVALSFFLSHILAIIPFCTETKHVQVFPHFSVKWTLFSLFPCRFDWATIARRRSLVCWGFCSRKNGRKLGRPFIQEGEEELPLNVSLSSSSFFHSRERGKNGPESGSIGPWLRSTAGLGSLRRPQFDESLGEKEKNNASGLYHGSLMHMFIHKEV